jgi:hypothetical protein
VKNRGKNGKGVILPEICLKNGQTHRPFFGSNSAISALWEKMEYSAKYSR